MESNTITIVAVIIAIVLCLSCIVAVAYSFMRNNSQINLLFGDFVFWLGLCSFIMVIVVIIIAIFMGMGGTNAVKLNYK